MKKQLLLSFSGGETSAHMTERCLNNPGMQAEYDMRVAFANTGCEDERTLTFVDKCDKCYGFGVFWVEAVVHPGRIGCTHRIVDFETASRKGEPFEAVIKKYGIPNRQYTHCTRELKANPIRSLCRSWGWTKNYTAVGIRLDEAKRRSVKAARERIIYPLLDVFPTTDDQVRCWAARQPVRLGLKGYEGNCTFCYKKSFANHAKLTREQPEAYDFPRRMELEHGVYPDGRRRVFFRLNKSTDELFALNNDEIISDDAVSECGGSCEPFGS